MATAWLSRPEERRRGGVVCDLGHENDQKGRCNNTRAVHVMAPGEIGAPGISYHN